MKPSILCYVPPNVEFLGLTTPPVSQHPQFSNQDHNIPRIQTSIQNTPSFQTRWTPLHRTTLLSLKSTTMTITIMITMTLAILEMTFLPTWRPWRNVLAAMNARRIWTDNFCGTSPNGFNSSMFSETQLRYCRSKSYDVFSNANIRWKRMEKNFSRTSWRSMSRPRKKLRRLRNRSAKICWFWR